MFQNMDDTVRLVPGDELKLKYDENGQTKWKSKGHIVKINNTDSEEICLELKNCQKDGLYAEAMAKLSQVFFGSVPYFKPVVLSLKIEIWVLTHAYLIDTFKIELMYTPV